MDSLIANYPEYTKVTDLKGEDEKIEETLLAVNCLLESGVLMTRSVAQTFDWKNNIFLKNMLFYEKLWLIFV